jgi:hypothetical protein
MHKESFPMAAALVDRNIVMDDFVVGAEDSHGLITIYYKLTSLMRLISLPMGKWASNSETLRKIWIVSGLEIKNLSQVLGVSWVTAEIPSSRITET